MSFIGKVNSKDKLQEIVVATFTGTSKVCNKCNNNLSLNNFYKNNSSKDGYSYECSKKRKKIYNKGPFMVICKVCNKEFFSRLQNGCFCSGECKKRFDKERLKKYYKENKDKRKKSWTKYNRSGRRRNNARTWACKRRKEDINFKLNEQISGAVYKHLIGRKGGRHWEDVIGQSFETIKQGLEKNFSDKINWDNYGSFWTIDHIIPKSLFDVTNKNEVKKCWDVRNLRPLEKSLNCSKGNRIDMDVIKEFNITDLLPKGER